ncbi:hypothetical protein ANCCAN_26242 [Ancylostoma caninum]|uniref:Uncharacterized protein n=1 Tax=Ancylostoma caninum TaxID=29170 RepID=A0A368FAT7_ANCCA|nr:hypothetical protein ANCCAN_26242 [Ancylostoma caninum]
MTCPNSDTLEWVNCTAIYLERAKLKANAEIPIDGVKVTVDQSVCDETVIISDIFNLNEMDALELVLSGESQKIHFDCLNRGLIAVVCYYDVHRLLAVLLRTMLEWDKESMHESLRGFIEQNFVQRTMFQHLLQLQASFNVTSEFHMLSQPHVNGLGGPRHQNLVSYIPVFLLFQATTAAAVLSNLVKEIRNETVWSDQSVCGTVQLACAIALRALAVSPADHLNITNVEVDVDKVVDRAIKNLAMVFIRHGVISSVVPDVNVGWDHVMSALRSYERLFRERAGTTSMFGHTLSAQQQPKPVIPPRELIGLITWVNLARTMVDLDDDAAEVFLEERQWAVLDAALGVVSAPVPLPLKGALLRLVAALAKREASALRIWNALNAHGLCTFAENGSLQGLQRELDERECAEEMFDTSLGFVHLLRSLLSHSHM